MTDITRKRGDTYADEFAITYKSTGEPVNLTGCTFKLTVDTRKNPTDTSTQIYQLSGTMADPTDGTVEFAPSAIQADRLGYFFYDVEMTDATGKKRTIESGKYVYTQDITK